MLVPPPGDDWVVVGPEPLPLGQLAIWPVVPGCGALVMFAGTVRDFSEGRPGVSMLSYEAYVEGAERCLRALASEARGSWKGLGRVALLHRTGLLVPTEVAVVVAISAPHRREAFESASWAIDNLKASAPIWKREAWDGGNDWAEGTHEGAVAGGQAGR